MKRFARCCMLAALVLSSASARAEIHALIMTISQYQGGVPALKGVAYDGENARAIAQKMGVKDENIRFLKDDQLTLAGIRAAFDELQSSLQPGDQVFVYYSGHGGRQYVRDGNSERCAESLITDDARGFIDAELEDRLKKLSEKAQKVIVFLDACHSGGVTTRSINAGFAPKYWSKGEADACAKPVNVLTRGLTLAAKAPGSGAQNYVYIAAARDNEISLDQPGKGGVATQAWVSCISGGARDIDGSGGLTAEEIRACAQDKIDQTLKGVVGYAPHHISITGNSELVMKLADNADMAPTGQAMPVQSVAAVPVAAVEPPVKPVEGVVPDAGVPVTAVVPPLKPAVGAGAVLPVALVTPSVKPAASAGSEGKPVEAAKPVKPSPIATMRDIYNGRDDKRVITLVSAKPALSVGKDFVDFTLSSTHPGYVYLLMVGSDGQAFDMIFPNKLDTDNYVDADEKLHLPRPNWKIKAQGPVGEDHLLAIVADSPRDFSAVGMKPAGPFSTVDASFASTRNIQAVASASANAASSGCAQGAATRNIGVAAKKCSNAYGAALVTVKEVE